VDYWSEYRIDRSDFKVHAGFLMYNLVEISFSVSEEKPRNISIDLQELLEEQNDLSQL
jgi:hypothetical protein